MTERGGGPPPQQQILQPSGAGGFIQTSTNLEANRSDIPIASSNNNPMIKSSSTSKRGRFPREDQQQQQQNMLQQQHHPPNQQNNNPNSNPYLDQQQQPVVADRKTSHHQQNHRQIVSMSGQAVQQQHSSLQMHAQQSTMISSGAVQQQQQHMPYQANNNNQLRVGNDFKMMNSTQQQISVSKMIQTRDSEAARRALQMSNQVKSNTMSVRDQIARIQQQVQMQKDKAKVQHDEQMHISQSIQMQAMQQQQNQQLSNQQLQQQQQQQQQQLQRNPLSGTIQMNMQNSMAKPVQQQPGIAAGQAAYLQSPQLSGQSSHINQKAAQLQQPSHQQQLHGQAASDQYLVSHQHQQKQQYNTSPSQHHGAGAGYAATATQSPNLNVSHHGGRKANQSELVQKQNINKSKMQMSNAIIRGSQQHGVGSNNNSASTVVRISKKPSGQTRQLPYQQQQPQHQAPQQKISDQEVVVHQSPNHPSAPSNNARVLKLKQPQVQTLAQKQSSAATNNNQEQGQLQITKKNYQQNSDDRSGPDQRKNSQSIDSNRLRQPGASQFSHHEKQQQRMKQKGKAQAHGMKNYKTALAVGSSNEHKVVDIMPAQQSNISAEDLDDDDGRTKEIPRQSVLSNLVQSSISNFDNESVEDAANEEEIDLNNVVTNKNSIKIDKQGSISGATANQNRPHNNLKSRKSQKAAKRKKEPYVVNRAQNDPYSQSVNKQQFKDQKSQGMIS